MIARRAYGKLLMLFRSWLLPGIRRRYGHGGGSTLRIDEELGTVTQGMYISFWNMLRESVGNREFIHTTYKKMSEMEQQNAKRTATELSAMVGAAALVAALANLDDDEESWASNFILYQAKRYHMEVTQWNPLGLGGETFRMMRSPTATARPVEKGIDLLQQLGNELGYVTGMPWVDEGDIFYQRRTGRFNKGDRKIRKDFEDLLPIWRGVTRSGSPEEAYKWFTSVK